jgi:Holliday junction resolvasome RuvABC endonuclease subunit
VIYYGIDPGLASCGFAALDQDAQLLDLRVITTKPSKEVGSTQARLAEVLSSVSEAACRFHGEYVATIEWPMVGGRNPREGRATSQSSSAQVFAAAGGLIGLMRGGFARIHTPSPATWRARLHGTRTNARQVLERIERQYEVSKRVGKTRAPHAVDAIGLALYGLHLANLKVVR